MRHQAGRWGGVLNQARRRLKPAALPLSSTRYSNCTLDSERTSCTSELLFDAMRYLAVFKTACLLVFRLKVQFAPVDREDDLLHEALANARLQKNSSIRFRSSSGASASNQPLSTSNSMVSPEEREDHARLLLVFLRQI